MLRMRRLSAVLSGAGLAALLVGPLPTTAHDWYPRSCCSDYDCYPIGASEVRPTDDGWRIRETGEVVPYGSTERPRVLPSEDGGFHRCSIGGEPARETLCLFVPAMGS